MSSKKIPFSWPDLSGLELHHIENVIRANHVAGDGEYTKKCHALLEETLTVPRVLLTTSCTHALEMAALLLRVGPGDEIIVPSFTFSSTVSAFVLRGARPVFIDIRPDTLNFDERLLEEKITPATRAIVVVHYAGVSCEMDEILRIATKHGLPVVEDNAHGLFATYRGRFLGTFGCLGTQSFHESKNFSCGEGGALLINDPTLSERAEIIREKGTNRSRFFRGQIDKYSWVDIGSSFLPSDLLAAVLYAQLERRDQIQARRKALWETYHRRLHAWAEEQGIQLPIVPPYCTQAYHMFYMIMPSLEARESIIKYLNKKNINSVFHYQPLHLSEMGKRAAGVVASCPVSVSIADRIVRLPFFFRLSDSDQERVIDSVCAFATGEPRIYSLAG